MYDIIDLSPVKLNDTEPQTQPVWTVLQYDLIC